MPREGEVGWGPCWKRHGDPGHEGIKGGVLILTELENRRIVPSNQRNSRALVIYSYGTFSTYEACQVCQHFC